VTKNISLVITFIFIAQKKRPEEIFFLHYLSEEIKYQKGNSKLKVLSNQKLTKGMPFCPNLEDAANKKVQYIL